MTVFQEGNILISFSDNVNVIKFDEKITNENLTHCMKSVDFVVEEEGHDLFIEFKDPENPDAREESRNDFFDRWKRGIIIEELKEKFRDTLIYRWASTDLEKPIYFWVLIEHEKLDAAELMVKTDQLKKKIPSDISQWKRQIVTDCGIFNIESWNRRLSKYPVRRTVV